MPFLHRVPRSLLPLGLVAALLGCSSEQRVRFAAKVGEQPLRCDASYPGIGTTGSTLQLLDFKAYVRDIVLVRANGERHALQLEEDGVWQRDGIALLDFEDGTGTCNTGSAATRTEVVGYAPAHDDYTAIELKVGVPKEKNHLDGARAQAPLNVPGMWWSWQGGYKYLKLDVRTTGNEEYFFHLGATGCTGSPAEGFQCVSENEVTVVLEGFHPDTGTVVFDVAGLLADSDVDHVIDNQTDFIAGCMSFAGDPECPQLMSRLGLTGSPAPTSGPGAFLRAE